LGQIGDELFRLVSHSVPDWIQLMPNDPVKVPEQGVLYRQVVQVDLDYNADRFSVVVKTSLKMH
jgi:hypothetical protein